MDRVTRLSEGCRRRPWLVLIVALAAAVVSILHARAELAINTATTDLLSRSLPFRQHSLDYKDAFPRFADQIVVIVDGRTPELADAAAELLAARMAGQPSLSDVYSPAEDPFFQRNGFLFLDAAALEDLLLRLSEAQPFLAALDADPSVRGLFGLLGRSLQAAEEGQMPAGRLVPLLDAIADTVAARAEGEDAWLSWASQLGGDDLMLQDERRLVLAQPRLDDGSLARARASIDAIEEIVAAHPLELQQRAQVQITGAPVLRQQELETVRAGAGIAGVVSLLLVTGILGLGVRSPAMILAVMVTLVLGLVVTLGLATLTVGQLNLISVAFAVLFIGLAVDFGIHLGLRFREERRLGGGAGDDRPAPAWRRSVEGAGPALALAALCAAIGFLSFLPTDYRGLAELGIISAIGMGVALLASLTVFPALIGLLPMRPQRTAPGAAAEGPLARLIRRRAGLIAGVAALSALGAAIAAPQARIDVNPINLQDPTLPAVQAFQDLLEEERGNPYAINVLTQDLAEARALEDALTGLPQVGATMTVADFVPAEQDLKLELIDELSLVLAFLGRPAAAAPPPAAAARRQALSDLHADLAAHLGRAPADRPLTVAAEDLARALDDYLERAADSPAALEALDQALVSGLVSWLDRLRDALAADLVTLDDLPDSVTSRWVSEDGRYRVEVNPAVELDDTAAMRAFAEPILERAPTATGAPIAVTEAGSVVLEAFLTATVIAVLAVIVVLTVVLRRPAAAALTVAPLFLAALWTVAVAALFDIPFNFANVIVLPLLFGLGASSSIHMVIRQRRTPDRDVLGTSTPRAVLLSALTTVASFGSLTLSPHQGMASMGLLLTIAIAMTLAAALVVLPSLMSLAGRRYGRHGRTTAPAEAE